MNSDVVDLLSNLIRIPSICGKEETIAHFIADWLGKNKLTVEMIDVKPNRPNVLVKLKGEAPGPRVMLNGHMDTVELGRNWVHDPLGAEIENGKMYGRGALDMKAGLSCIMWAVAALRGEGLPKRGELIFAAVVDEEVVARGTYALIQTNLTKGVDFAMVPEPTDLKVITAHRGRAVFNVRVHGKSAHSSRPGDGINAIENAAALIHAFGRIHGPLHPKIGAATINTLKIEGGQEEVMLVPDNCRIVIDRCLVPGYTVDAALGDLCHLINEIGIDAEAELPARETPFCEPFEIPDDDPHVQLIAETASRILEKKAEISFHDGPCDSCLLVNQGKIPTIEFGPAGYGLHQPDEYVQLESVRKTAAVYHSVLSKILA
jgi:acetylornithine deacetylase/succinyl-diaminopimelate desuccinylase family protein